MRYTVDDATGCWLWNGAKHRGGYGVVQLDGKRWLAHRVAYSLWVGPILSKKYDVHHTCQSPSCINPEHLELLTRSNHWKHHNPLRSACRKGHPFDEANTYIRANGERQCRRCKAIRERERQRRLREAAGLTQPPARTLSPDP